MIPDIDPTKAKLRTTYKHSGTYFSLCAYPDDSRLFVGSTDYAVHLFDLNDPGNKAVGQWRRHDNYVSALTFIRGPRSGDMVISGSFDRQLIWWESVSGRPLRSVPAHNGWIRDLAAFPDHERVASVGDDMLVKIWDAKTGRALATMEGHPTSTPQGHVTALYVVTVSPDGKLLATADRIGEVRVWEVRTAQLLHKFKVPVLYTYDPRQRKRSIGGVRSLAFFPDGRRLAVGGMGQVDNVDGMAGLVRIEVCDWESGKTVRSLNADGHKGIVNDMCVYSHPSGPRVIGAGGGGDNGFIAFWDPDQSKPIHKIKTDGHFHRITISRSGKQLFAAGYEKLQLWDLGA